MTRPLASRDPLAALLVPPLPGAGFGAELRTALVVSWDTSDGTHTLKLDGVFMDDLPILDSVDYTAVVTGQLVALLGTRDGKGVVTYGIVGTFQRPPF